MHPKEGTKVSKSALHYSFVFKIQAQCVATVKHAMNKVSYTVAFPNPRHLWKSQRITSIFKVQVAEQFLIK